MITKIANVLKTCDSNFPSDEFIKISHKNLNKLEMKDRVKQIAKALEISLPYNYKKNTKLMIKTLAPSEEQHESKLSGFQVWPYAQYVESYGQENFEVSMQAMYEITKRFTSEFSIRPFIDLYPDDLYEYLKTWCHDPNHHVRRLCSEGIRPNLPWGLKSQYVIKNLKKNIEILELLKSDSSEYVRKSVANHLNDISRIDELLFLKLVKRWKKENKSKEMEKLIRHACRTLLKNGQKDVLKLHGYEIGPSIKLTNFKVSPKEIKEGDNLNINLRILNKDQKHKETKLLIDYIIHYKKKSGYSQKVFRLRDTKVLDELEIEKNIHFKKVTTRKHYPGKHYIEIQINGLSQSKKEFILNET